jgi:hypothetical protein
MNTIAFLALAQAHQHLHWLPAALELSRRPGVRVDVLCPSRAGLKFIRGFDPKRRLNLFGFRHSGRDGLFDLPSRKRVHTLYRWLFRDIRCWSPPNRPAPGFATIPISFLSDPDPPRRRRHRNTCRRHAPRSVRSFTGWRKQGQAPPHRRRLATEENCIVTGYAKFELVKRPTRLFRNPNPIAIYNPHSRPELSSWFMQGEELVRQMEQISDWNFVVAPHVKLEGGPAVSSTAPNVLIDYGSVRSIDMSYVQAASLYIGDASSQVYEFLLQPRPCIFINSHGAAWQGKEEYAHFALGQVIGRPDELGPALARANSLQQQFEPLQRLAMKDSIDDSPVPASIRQADAILAFVRSRNR